MEREIYSKLLKWKNSKNRKPLILKGARQVGKTYTLKEFGKKYYENTLYVNFENTGEDIFSLFQGEIEPKRIINILSGAFGINVIPGKTLIIFDEVQEVPRALTSLKYFHENASEYHICAAGSLLGIFLKKSSFPVGKVDYLNLGPLSFKEFINIVNPKLIETIKECGINNTPSIISEKLKDALKIYFIIGGMPEVVNSYIKNSNFKKCEEILNAILQAYKDDFSKHTDRNTSLKVEQIFNTLPSQFAGHNSKSKFLYGVIKNGARAREYEGALNWLINSGIALKVPRVSVGNKIPLKFYEDIKSFKIYLNDVGLLRVLSQLDYKNIILGSKIYSEFNGVYTEQFVLQQFISTNIFNTIFYWSNNSTAEIDFVFNYNNNVIPIEVKAGKNVVSKSLKEIFIPTYNTKLAVRFSMLDIEYNEKILNIPLYLIFNFTEYLNTVLNMN